MGGAFVHLFSKHNSTVIWILNGKTSATNISYISNKQNCYYICGTAKNLFVSSQHEKKLNVSDFIIVIDRSTVIRSENWLNYSKLAVGRTHIYRTTKLCTI